MKKTQIVTYSSGAALLGSAGMASAAIDLAGVTTSFTDLNAAIVVVGGLILSASVTAVVYKWLKGMIFS